MSYSPQYSRQRGGRNAALRTRLLIAGAILLFSLISYLSRSSLNVVTGERQRVGMSVDEEIQLGLMSVESMTYQHQGPSRDLQATAAVQMMGRRLIHNLEQLQTERGSSLPYQFNFHLLADRTTVNAFALPGGQVFITQALYDQFTNEGQLAGVLGHEIGHVIERHSAEHMAKSNLLRSMAGAAGVAGGDISSAQIASAVGNLINMKYGRNDELESDGWGVKLMVMAGFSPEHMIEVMDILESSSGGGGQPDFLSSHPSPANRRQHIETIIEKQFPEGLPPGLHAP